MQTEEVAYLLHGVAVLKISARNTRVSFITLAVRDGAKQVLQGRSVRIPFRPGNVPKRLVTFNQRAAARHKFLSAQHNAAHKPFPGRQYWIPAFAGMTAGIGNRTAKVSQ